MSGAEFRWSQKPTDGIGVPLQKWAAQIPMLIFKIAGNYAKVWESKAKEIRPWTDRSNAARGGLTGLAVLDGMRTTIICFHQAQHGIYLETGTKRMRRYASIIPAMNITMPRLMVNLEYGITQLMQKGTVSGSAG